LLTHAHIWRAIDALAARQGLTASGLARQAGLDPTSFNKSKRGDAGGKLRWPSTESIAKILAATGVTLQEFVALIEAEKNAR
jgi:phage repressor protein C with HTH and peptisase S24 domain